MTLHIQTANVLELIASLGDPPLETMTPIEARAMVLKYQVESNEPIFATKNIDAGGVPARLYLPSNSPNLGLCIYFHGGGWVFGTLDGYEDVCRCLANLSGHAVLSVDYRLAPEFAFPAPLDDCITATRWVRDNAASFGCDPSRLVVCGDSAGGNLATLVAQHSGVPLKLQLLIYPATDLRRGSLSYKENADGYRLTAAAMKWFVDHYLSSGVVNESDPQVSPMLADDSVLAKMPPAFIITAEYDPLRDEAEEYARRLNSLGVPTSLTRYFGQIHGFFSMSRFLDDGHHAIAQVASAIRRALFI